MKTEEKRRMAVIDIINKMFEIAGHEVTYDDIKDRKDDWYTQWTMTIAQSDEWSEWGRQYLRKNLKMSIKMASSEMGWISLMWGLKFSENPWKSEC